MTNNPTKAITEALKQVNENDAVADNPPFMVLWETNREMALMVLDEEIETIHSNAKDIAWENLLTWSQEELDEIVSGFKQD